MIKFSFIIPVRTINAYVQELIPKILAIPRDDFEIIICTDKPAHSAWPKAKIVSSGEVSPTVKRNLAAKIAQGEILNQDFLNEKVAAVGGPAITPKENNFWQKVSGATFLSSLSGGFPERYRPFGPRRFINDWPTANLSIRKKAYNEVGGCGSEYWPGEDTVLCFNLLEQKNAGVLYDPELVVYHHRREGLWKHIMQISGYGLHRGFFVKKFTRTSLNWRYFLPSLLVIFVIGGAIASYFAKLFFLLYLFGWGVYLVALGNAFYDIYKYEKNFLIALASLYYIFLTHIFYGLRFLQGLLFTRELKLKLK